MEQTPMERELLLEEDMQGQGVRRFWEAIQKAKEHKEESNTVYGAQLIQQFVQPLGDVLEAFITAPRRGGGHMPVARKYIQQVGAEVSALLTLKTVLDALSSRWTVQKASVAIGMALEDEIRFRHFAEDSKKLWDGLTNKLTKRGYDRKRRRTTLIYSMNKISLRKPTLHWQEWSRVDQYHVGMKCLDLLIQTTQLVQLYTTTTRGKGKKKSAVTYVEATPSALQWVEGKTTRCELMTPVFLPMVVPPKPWTSPKSGGYYSPSLRPLKLVKTRAKRYLEELGHQVEQMPKLYAAINAVQSTPWRVNARVLNVMREMWDGGSEAGDLPSRLDIPLPPKPHTIDTDPEVKTQWKREAAQVYSDNVKLRSRRMQMVKLLYLAERYEQEDVMYFPHQLDFRGRMYAVPSFLNPQGNDMAKALLEFAEGKEVGLTGVRWLMIHAANTWGADKCSLEDRVQWAQTNKENIVQSALDPLGHRWWTEADKPWQFLAVCFEIQASLHNEGHISYLPVSVDGTCNGLQNFSAMLRDAVGGKATNLVPTLLPQDIYQRVADVAHIKVAHESVNGEPMAMMWRDWGFDRKATKRPVMVLPYGGTIYSCRQYLQEYIMERVGKGEVAPWGDEHFEAAVYLSRIVWHSIGEVVVAARAAMGWLQVAASLAACEDLPVHWRTPVGFPVYQAYTDTRERRVSTLLGDKVVKHSLREDTDKLDKRKQASGVSPNFVHSMDAACLMLSVNRCLEAGITHFGMVHDSYGTHAADMEMMSVCLREAFVELYESDVLAQFRESIAGGLTEENLALLPPVPPRGTLDLSLVTQSVYFFA